MDKCRDCKYYSYNPELVEGTRPKGNCYVKDAVCMVFASTPACSRFKQKPVISLVEPHGEPSIPLIILCVITVIVVVWIALMIVTQKGG